MLAYAANRPIVAERRSAPNAMLAIIALHVAGVAALMSAKMDLPGRIMNDPIVIDLVNAPKPPPEQPVETAEPQPRHSTITRPAAQVPLPTGEAEVAASTPHLPSFEDVVGPKIDPPRADPTPAPVRIGPRLATPASELRPAYPRSKLASGEEAVLRLRLTIDERGRVVAVEPAGPADPTFLEAARRHLLARWRYRPASEGGRPVASSAVITLRFQLDG
jgi:periplasmic protein TonB